MHDSSDDVKGLNVNLGCGDRYVDGWTNVDHETPHRVDERVDLTGELPWEPGSISRIFSGHLFEHLTPEQCRKLCERLLKCADPVGCAMVIVGPDIDIAEQMVSEGTFDFTYHSLEGLKFGAGRWAGDEHLWFTTGPVVAGLIRAAGWPVVHLLKIEELEGGWPVAERQWKWQYAVRAWAGDPSRL